MDVLLTLVGLSLGSGILGLIGSRRKPDNKLREMVVMALAGTCIGTGSLAAVLGFMVGLFAFG